MKIGIVAPSSVPFVIGGAEKLWWGLQREINGTTHDEAELVKLPVRETDLWNLARGYRAFLQLDLTHFDRVISTKYPAWAIQHENHHVYLQHKLRGLYDAYHLTGLPVEARPRHPTLRRILAWVDGAPADTTRLHEILDMLETAAGEAEAFGDEADIPSPFARRVVHFLDACALAPGRIRRYAAISHNVKRRADYFPPHVAVDVIHHPSDLALPDNSAFDYGFTVGRLDGAKRIELLVRAMLRSHTTQELRIAGTGPARARLEALAADDARIRFLGRLTDAEVRAQYAGAGWVPYIPYDEDYGLVTVEALGAGKPVVTCRDSGGVLEFVRDGENGLVTAPEPGALAAAIDRLATDPPYARQLGSAGPAAVRHVTWRDTLERLLRGGTLATPAPTRPRGPDAKPRLVVVTTFPVYPPVGGGRSRIHNLYKALAERAHVRLLTLGAGDDAADSVIATGGAAERRIARTAAQGRADRALEQQLHVSAEDIGAIDGWRHNPVFRNALAEELAAADIAVASHPYLFDAIRAQFDGPLWYEAHNVETDLKAELMPDTPAGRRALGEVRRVEGACCRAAELVFACTQADLDRLGELFGIEGRRAVVPNAVDPQRMPYAAPSARAARKRALGLDARPLGVFMGSAHPPNVEAVRAIGPIAEACPDHAFVIFGSVSQDPASRELPDTVRVLGQLPESQKKVLLTAADAGLNPMLSGSGSNLKMLDYFAAGLPTLTTPFGARGIDVQDGQHVLQRPIDGFPAGLRALHAMAASDVDAMAAAARRLAETRYAWRTAAATLGAELPTDAPQRSHDDAA